MSSRQTNNLQQPAVTEESVAEYLRLHPDFFDNHIDLVAELRLRHPALGAVSLIERQVSVLREQKRELEKKLNNLIQIARENDSLSKRMQKLTLLLMEKSNVSELFSELHDRLVDDFQADSVVIRLLQGIDSPADDERVAVLRSEDEAFEAFRKFFSSRRPICGRLNKAQSRYLFADESEVVRSAALIPICDKQCFGLLAIGSKDPKRFHPAMGTVFLTHMGEVIGRALRPYMTELMK